MSRNSCSRAFSRPYNSDCSAVISSSFSARSPSTADTRICSERVSSGKRWRLVSTAIRLAYSSVMSFPSPIRQGTFTHKSCSAAVRRRFPDSISYSPFPAERTRSGSVMPIRAIDELSSDRSPPSVKIGERRGSSLSSSILYDLSSGKHFAIMSSMVSVSGSSGSSSLETAANPSSGISEGSSSSMGM